MLSKAIKKPKKSELDISIEGSKKPYAPLEVELEMYNSSKPESKMKYDSGIEDPKKGRYTPMEMKTTPYEPGIKKTPETEMEMELMLQGAKKEKSNAYTEDLGKFEVPKDEKGMFKESGESRAKYLRKLKKMKS